jgi:deoxyribodipyrimidine photolyase-related protein
MSSITLIFPHQLFKKHPAIHPQRPIYLIEEELYFNQYNFHQKKLVLDRASMKYYADYLQQESYTVNYIEAASKDNSIAHLIKMTCRKPLQKFIMPM